MAKVRNVKTCGNQKCKFKRCWINAELCEKCGWSFKLQRMPRKKQTADIDEDIIDKEIEEHFEKQQKKESEKKSFQKLCPECGHNCFHLATICENCDYDFVNKQKKKHEEDKVVVKSRIKIGCRPIWNKLKKEKWMKFDPKKEDLKTWGNNFMRELRKMFPGKHIFAESVVSFADEFLPQHAYDLAKIFAVIKNGWVNWITDSDDPRLENGEILMEEEQHQTHRHFQKWLLVG